MSDTVKIIVELSKGQYEHLKDTQYGGIGARMIFNKVVKGKPLSDVLAEIKEEIQEKLDNCKEYGWEEESRDDVIKAYTEVIEIIDKHISKEETIEGIFLNVSEIKTNSTKWHISREGIMDESSTVEKEVQEDSR